MNLRNSHEFDILNSLKELPTGYGVAMQTLPIKELSELLTAWFERTNKASHRYAQERLLEYFDSINDAIKAYENHFDEF